MIARDVSLNIPARTFGNCLFCCPLYGVSNLTIPHNPRCLACSGEGPARVMGKGLQFAVGTTLQRREVLTEPPLPLNA